MSFLASDLLSFINKCPSAFHTVGTVREELLAAGYRPLNEADVWSLHAGGKYFVTRNQSSLIAFSLPSEADPSGFMIAASHSDSPSFKLLPSPESVVADSYIQARVERYGGLLSATWLDRPLSCAGRVTVREGDTVACRLVDMETPLFLIPSLAIHMNREANKNASYNDAVDMQPILGTKIAKGHFFSYLADLLGVYPDDILSYDLYLYPKTEGCVWGIDREFISSPRLDDLQGVYASLKGFLAADEAAAIPVLAVFDNEEVGSGTMQGADSTFLSDTLMRINEALGGTVSDYHRALASSLMLSVDNAHAIHPNHPEVADTVNRPRMNEGIVIKHSASQRYTTSAPTDGLFTTVCQRAGVPVQHFTNRPDLPGGSTLGNISGTQVSLHTVDIGLPQLAMHSSYETAGVKDIEYLVTALSEFYSTSLSQKEDGLYLLS